MVGITPNNENNQKLKNVKEVNLKDFCISSCELE